MHGWLQCYLARCYKLLYPPQTVFVGGYTVFTLSVLPTVCVCVCPLRFVSLITLRTFDGISSNFANTFICTRQILLIKKQGLGTNTIGVISLCNS